MNKTYEKKGKKNTKTDNQILKNTIKIPGQLVKIEKKEYCKNNNKDLRQNLKNSATSEIQSK